MFRKVFPSTLEEGAFFGEGAQIEDVPGGIPSGAEAGEKGINRPVRLLLGRGIEYERTDGRIGISNEFEFAYPEAAIFFSSSEQMAQRRKDCLSQQS